MAKFEDNDGQQTTPRVPWDNGVRSAVFLEVADKRNGLLNFGVQLLGEDNLAAMNLRLRGILPRRLVDGDTYTYIEKIIGKGEHVTLQFHKKGIAKSAPWLVDVWNCKGVHVNKWLLENEYASKFDKTIRDSNREAE